MMNLGAGFLGNEWLLLPCKIDSSVKRKKKLGLKY